MSRAARIAARVRCLSLAWLLACAPVAAGPWRATDRNVYGWQFMTPDERVEHQRLLRAFHSRDECLAYQAQHHALMAERARQAGKTLERAGETPCERLKAEGRLQ